MTKTQWKVKIKGIIIGLFVILTFFSTFLHNEFTKLKEWTPYKTHYKNYSKIVKGADKKYNLLAEELKNIGQLDLSDKLFNITKQKALSLKGFHKTRKELKKKFSYRGYESLRLFLHEFGRSIYALIISLLFIFIVIFPKLIGEIRIILMIGGFGFIGISFFWVFHSIIPVSDLPQWSYNLTYIVSAILATIITYIIIYFIKKIVLKKNKVQKDLEKLVITGNELFDLNRKSI
ncbi:membrane hypothetical protein [Tenacibaculum amylolyticum]